MFDIFLRNYPKNRAFITFTSTTNSPSLHNFSQKEEKKGQRHKPYTVEIGIGVEVVFPSKVKRKTVASTNFNRKSSVQKNL